jgi:hypothetical protein
MPVHAASMGGSASAKEGGAAEAASARLQPLLAALAGNAAVTSCLARACAQLHAKKRLKAGKVAAGLQRLLSVQGASLHAWSSACDQRHLAYTVVQRADACACELPEQARRQRRRGSPAARGCCWRRSVRRTPPRPPGSSWM